jgi:glycosyltransferase involved in cell wall biosynthesis
MKILFFANKMPDLCGAFLHDIDLGTELLRRGHTVVFLTIKVPPNGVNGGTYRDFRYLHYSAASTFLETSDVWVCPHAPILPEVRKLSARGYNRPIVATCHYDGNYTMITKNSGREWAEMLMFINSIMESNYRKNISPWPSQIRRTETVRPILHRNQIVIDEPFQGDRITLINANENKGVHQFLELARRMPERKFLGVRPYYGNMTTPLPLGGNIEWVPFSDDIRTILRRTRILLFPSYYESFGRVAVEAMVNGIPVLYSKPSRNSPYPGGSMEAVQAWIGDAAIACDRDTPEDWMEAIRSLDDEASYADLSARSRSHIDSMDLFTEASRIAGLVESFARENPPVIRVVQSAPQATGRPFPKPLTQPTGPVGFGFVNGQLRIRR